MSSEADAAGSPLPQPAPAVRFADIVFVDAVVVLTPDDALAAGFPIIAATVTSRIPPVPGPDDVLLPFRNPPGARHPATGLTRRAGVVATWLVVVDPATIAGHSGYVPSRAMAVIHARTAAAAKALGGWP